MANTSPGGPSPLPAHITELRGASGDRDEDGQLSRTRMRASARLAANEQQWQHQQHDWQLAQKLAVRAAFKCNKLRRKIINKALIFLYFS